MSKLSIRLCALALIGLLACASFSSPMTAASQTIVRARVLVGGTIIDGSGRPRFRANLRIVGDRIAAIGQFRPQADEEVMDARGLVIAPGFIDIHNHSESGLLSEPQATTQVAQGITTLAVGPDGASPFPIADYLTKLETGVAPNVLAFIGHATVRYRVMGTDYKRLATADEITRMAELVEQGMQEGAFGLSSGLEYDVGNPCSTEELIALARVAARYRGIYMSHIRDEEEGIMSALREAIRIGREAKLPVQISHIKMGNKLVWNRAAEVVALINRARHAGLDITADCYPYTAWASTITILVPSRRHEDRQAVATGLDNVGGADKVLITNCSAHSDYEGRTLAEIAAVNKTTSIDAYMQIVKDGGASVVCSSMNEADVRTFYRQRWVMVSSDGGIGTRHPRGAGTFPKVLGQFVREKRWLPLEEAIRKMSALPAARLGLTDRGLLRKGMKADLVLFDPQRVTDRSTFKEPLLLAAGVRQVLVNGETVWEGDKTTGRLPGAVLRRGR